MDWKSWSFYESTLGFLSKFFTIHPAQRFCMFQEYFYNFLSRKYGVFKGILSRNFLSNIYRFVINTLRRTTMLQFLRFFFKNILAINHGFYFTQFIFVFKNTSWTNIGGSHKIMDILNKNRWLFRNIFRILSWIF